MKVLIVDDAGFIRHFLAREVQDAGREVVTAASGAEALQILKEDMTIGIVLCDLFMPGMDGFEVFKNALAIERFNDQGRVDQPKFILITSYRPSEKKSTSRRTAADDPAIMAECLGFYDVMYKSVDRKTLVAKIEEIEQLFARSSQRDSEESPRNTIVHDEKEGTESPPSRLSNVHQLVDRLLQQVAELDAGNVTNRVDMQSFYDALYGVTEIILDADDTLEARTACESLEQIAIQMKEAILEKPTACLSA